MDSTHAPSVVAPADSLVAERESLPIDWVTVHGFRSFRALEKLELGQINLMIGPNGAGKSNFLKLLSFVGAIFAGRLQHYVRKVGGAHHLLHYGANTTRAIEIEISLGGGSNNYFIRVEPTSDGSVFVASERALFAGTPPDSSSPFELNTTHDSAEAAVSNTDLASNRHPALEFIRSHISRWEVCHFQSTDSFAPLRDTSTQGPSQYLSPDGSNLAGFLYCLKQYHETAYSLIRRTVRVSAPFLEDFVLEPFGEHESSIRLKWKHVESREVFDVSALSDGTLRLIALSALLLQPTNYMPSTILLDEPEAGLHPLALNMVGGLIRSTAAVGPQLIVSTQSSRFLDGFDPNDVLVANRVSGETQISPINQDDIADSLQDHSLGELWEMNAIGGRP